MSKLLLEKKFIVITRGMMIGFPIFAIAFLSQIQTTNSIEIDDSSFTWFFLGTLLHLFWYIFGGIGALAWLYTLIMRSNSVIRVYEDRVELTTKFLTEKITRIEASKIESVNVKDTFVGKKTYGSVFVTGSGGAVIGIFPIANQHDVAEAIRGIASSPSKKDSTSNNAKAEQTPSTDLASQIEALDKLRKSGALTETEYKAAKAKILG